MQTSPVELSLYEEILEVLPDAVLWVKPVTDAGNHIVDFEIQYANNKAEELLGYTNGSLKGLWVRRDAIPHAKGAEDNFSNYLKIYESNEPSEYSYVTKTGVRIEIERRKLHGGILGSTRDRKAQREAERSEQEKSLLLDAMFENAPLGVLVYEAIRDEAGAISDFRIKLYNQAVHQLTGISEEERCRFTIKQLLEKVNAKEMLLRYINAVESGQSFSFDFFSPLIHRWLHMSVVKLGDGFLIIQSDITEIKSVQQALRQQSEYLNGIFNASLNGIYVLDAIRDQDGHVIDFKITTCNHRYAELTGWPIEQVVGQSFLTLFPHTRDGVFQMFCQVIEQNEPHRQEMYYAKSFNRWYDYIAVKLGDNGIVVTFQEITKQREAAIQIEQQKILLDNILKNSPSGIAVYKALRNEEGKLEDLQCIITNDAVERFTQISNNDRLEMTVRQLMGNFYQTPIYPMVVSAFETGGPLRMEYYHAPVQRWLELSAVRMDEERLINVFTDITEIKETQFKLEALVEELRRSNADLEDFAHVASHDLQEPLRKIRTFSDRLRRDLEPVLSEDNLRVFERMDSAASRMRNLISDLLTYSQVSYKPAVMEDVDLNEVIQLVLQDLEASIQECGASLHIDRLPVIQGNDRQLRQMFQNLLSNALKYRKTDTKPEVSVRCRLLKETDPLLQIVPGGPKESYYLVEVADNGIGFEQEHAQKIFKVFQRLHGRSEYEGTGVGLAIVQKVVTNHKGYITAFGEPYKGASFLVFLPVS